MECPACSSKRFSPFERFAAIYTCRRCGAVFGTCYLGDSYAIVAPRWHDDPNPPPEALRYFDLDCLGSKGIERRHGWMHRETRRIVQTG